MITERKKQPPAFQFYASDFIGGTSHFTDAEAGLYIRLLCAQWFEGGLPNDDAELASYGKGNTRLDRIKAKFTVCDDGKLRHHKLEDVRRAQQEYREQQSQNAKKRWVGNATAYATAMPTHMPKGMPNACQTHALQSPSPTPIDAQTNRGHPKLADVVAFGQMRGLSQADCEQFWHHFESTGWIDKNGHAVLKWQSKLMTWKAAGQAAMPTKRKPYISELKTVLEAKKAQRQAIHNRGHEDALGWRAKTPEDAAEHKRLTREINELTNQIAETKV